MIQLSPIIYREGNLTKKKLAKRRTHFLQNTFATLMMNVHFMP